MGKISSLYQVAPFESDHHGPESLTSLFRRLCVQHRLRPLAMFKVLKELYPQESSAFSLGQPSDHAQLHGAGQRAAIFEKTLEDAMACQPLRTNTLLPLAHVVARNGQGVLHPYRRWCIDCTQEQLEDGVESQWFPLLWSVKGVDICLRHNRRLSQYCPHCEKPQRFLPHQARLDLCDRCSHSLMFDGDGENDLPTEAEKWMARQLKAVISSDRYAVSDYDSDCVARFLSEIAAVNKIRKNDLGGLFGLHKYTVAQWANGRYKPSLDLLLHLLFNAQVPLNLLLNHPYAAARQANISRKGSKPTPAPKKRASTWIKRDHGEIRRGFSTILETRPNLILKEVAEELGIPKGTAYHIASDIYREHIGRGRGMRNLSELEAIPE